MIIIEKISGWDWKFLDKNWKPGMVVDVSPVMDKLLDFSRYFTHLRFTKNLEYFKWAVTNIPFDSEDYACLHYMGLVELIKIAEEVVPSAPGSKMTRRDFVELSLHTMPGEDDDMEDYIDWLIEIGRASLLDPDTVREMVEQLSDFGNFHSHNTIQKLFSVILLMSSGRRHECIKQLLELCVHTGPKKGTPLLRLMVRSGLFSLPVEMGQLLKAGKIVVPPSVPLSQEQLDAAWKETINTDNRELELVSRLVHHSNWDDTRDVEQVIRTCSRLSTELLRYGMCILTSIVDQRCHSGDLSTDLHQVLASRMVFNDKFIPILWSVDNPSLVTEATRLLLANMAFNWIKTFHGCMIESSNKDIYIAAANSLLQDIKNGLSCTPRRIARIIQLLGTQAKLDIFFEKQYLPNDVVQQLLKEVRRRKVPDLPRVLDRLLSKCCHGHGEGGVLVMRNIESIGDLTLHAVMFDVTRFNHEPNFSKLLARVEAYSLHHVTDYVYGLVERFLINWAYLHSATQLKTPVFGTIHRVQTGLVVGSHLYQSLYRIGHGQVLLDAKEPISLPATKCSACPKILKKIFYSSGTHGKYLCPKCVDPSKKSDSTVTCLVCLTGDNTMGILACGHCVCLDCAKELDSKCPLCKKPFDSIRRELTVDDVVRKFFDEWRHDAKGVEERSKALLEEAGGIQSDADMSDDGSFDSDFS